MKSPHLFLVAAVVALFATASQNLHAQVLLIVNESNPSAVTITGTGIAPSAPDTDTFFNGIDLLNFYTTDASTSGASVPGSTLTTGDPASAGPTFDTVYADDVSDGPPYVGALPYLDLNLYSGTSLANETFSTSEPAFNAGGTLSFDSTGFGLAGTSGIVIAGYSGDDFVPIGTYEIVGAAPEPSTWALMLGGLGLLAFWRLRTRRA